MSQSIAISRSFTSSSSFIAAQRELYREYRASHKLDKDAEAKYVLNVKNAATYIDTLRNSSWVFGKVAPSTDRYQSFVVLRKIKNEIIRSFIAIDCSRDPNLSVVAKPEFSPLRFTPPEVAEYEDKMLQADDDEPRMGVCPVCGKLVDLEWHDHADEAGQLDEAGE